MNKLDEIIDEVLTKIPNPKDKERLAMARDTFRDQCVRAGVCCMELDRMKIPYGMDYKPVMITPEIRNVCAIHAQASKAMVQSYRLLSGVVDQVIHAYGLDGKLKSTLIYTPTLPPAGAN